MTAIHLALPDVERVSGGLFGLLVGDALGVPYEFHDASALPAADAIEMTPSARFRRAHRGVPPGTWSDDGAQALVLLTSLLEDGGLDLDRFSQRLLDWRDRGLLAVDRKVFDVGIQTYRALGRVAAGTPAASAGPNGERDNGNGSLMRVLPLALWHRGSDVELMQLAARQSLVTHGHARTQTCCALYCLWARAMLQAKPQPWDRAVAALHEYASGAGLDTAEVTLVTDPANAERVHGTGYVLDTLWSARWAVTTAADYAHCVRSAISLGNDTDTTACVAGGIAGIRYGASGIPPAWRDALRGADLLQPLLTRLLRRYGDDARAHESN